MSPLKVLNICWGIVACTMYEIQCIKVASRDKGDNMPVLTNFTEYGPISRVDSNQYVQRRTREMGNDGWILVSLHIAAVIETKAAARTLVAGSTSCLPPPPSCIPSMGSVMQASFGISSNVNSLHNSIHISTLGSNQTTNDRKHYNLYLGSPSSWG